MIPAILCAKQTSMRKRSFSIILLVVALLFSAWSNVIAAASCPRYMLNGDCGIMHAARQPQQVEHESSCQREMADMEMDDMQLDDMQKEVEPPPKSGADSIAENSTPGNC